MNEDVLEIEFLTDEQISGDEAIVCQANEEQVSGTIWIGELSINEDEHVAFIESGIANDADESFFVVSASIPLTDDNILSDDETECDVEVTTPETFAVLIDGQAHEAATEELMEVMAAITVEELSWQLLGDDEDADEDE